MESFLNILVVFIGSGTGGAARYLIGKLIKSNITPSSFPWETFTVNILGCFIIGILYGISADSQWLSPRLKLLLAVGFCGGFTTFSTFANENYLLLNNSNLLSFAIYTTASIVTGILAVALGYYLTR